MKSTEIISASVGKPAISIHITYSADRRKRRTKYFFQAFPVGKKEQPLVNSDSETQFSRCNFASEFEQ